MKISKYTKLGLLIILSLAILIWGINYLKGIDFFKINTNYYVVYDRIDGLLESSEIMINGYKVGQVTDIDFMEDHSGRILVELSLEGRFKISQGSTAKIVSNDIMGTKSIKLEINPADEFYKADDTIPGSIESDLKEQVSMQVLPLKKKAEELIASLDSAITVVTYVFNEKTRKNLSESFEHLNHTIGNIDRTSEELRKMIENGSVQNILSNMDSITTAIKNNDKQIEALLSNLSAISDTLAGLSISPVVNNIAESVSGINQLIHKLSGTDSSLGLLLNDPELYNNLNDLAFSLDILLKDVRSNPKRYVHFSAFDMGKNVYITNNPKTSSQILFKVNLISSPAKLPIDSEIFKGLGLVEELSIGETYNYLIGESGNFDVILDILEEAKQKFPDASIVAFKNGRQIKLEKALKKVEHE